jgi:hypothetical protein
MRVEFTNVHAINDDPRKLPWLWEGYTLVKVKVPSKRKPGEMEEHDMVWDGLYQFNPITSQGRIIHLKTGSPVYGMTVTKFNGSGWTEEFSDKAIRTWEKAFAEYLDDILENANKPRKRFKNWSGISGTE